MSEVKQDRIVRESFITRILENLYNWLPFRRQSNGSIVQVNADGQSTNVTTNENEIALGNYNETDINTLLSVGIGSEQQRKNAISINKDGEIFIITDLKTSSVESLQKRIENNTLTVCKTIDELLLYKNEQHISKLLYLTDTVDYNEITYYAGLYSVSKDNSNNVFLFNLGISANVDLSNYYTKEEVDLIIDKVNAGEIDLLNYYTKSEIDKTVDDINTRLEDVEDFIKNPIQTTELEIITNTDLNNDNKIG